MSREKSNTLTGEKKAGVVMETPTLKTYKGNFFSAYASALFSAAIQKLLG